MFNGWGVFLARLGSVVFEETSMHINIVPLLLFIHLL